MNNRPSFVLLAGEKDITKTVLPFLVSLTVTDETGFGSDTLEIVLADPSGTMELPRRNSWLSLRLGYADGVMRDFGRYDVDEVSAEGPPDMITIHAKSDAGASGLAVPRPDGSTPPVNDSLQTQKKRNWPAGYFGAIATKIIAEHPSLSTAAFTTDKTISGQWLPGQYQTNESDLAFLTRICRANGWILKIVDGRLIINRVSSAATASGKPLPVLALRPHDVSNWRIVFGGNKPYAQAIAYYHDKKAAREVEVIAGSGEPTFRFQHPSADRESAERDAQSRINGLLEGLSEITVNMPMNTAIIAEQPLDLAGFRDGLNGRWLASRIEHRFSDAGATTAITARQSAAK